MAQQDDWWGGSGSSGGTSSSGGADPWGANDWGNTSTSTSTSITPADNGGGADPFGWGLADTNANTRQVPVNTSTNTNTRSFDNVPSMETNNTRKDAVSALSPQKGVYIGVAHGMQSMENKRGFLGAWLDSVIYGVPLVNGKVRNVFNLQLPSVDNTMDIAQQRSIAVTFYGDVNAGLIGSGQTMEVHGGYGPDHTIYATEIINRTNGSTVRIDTGIPGLLVRIITAVLVGLLARVIFGAVTGVSLPGNGAGFLAGVNWQSIIIGVLLVAAGLWFLIHKLRNPGRGTFMVVGALVVVGLYFLMPDLVIELATGVIIIIVLWNIMKKLLH